MQFSAAIAVIVLSGLADLVRSFVQVLLFFLPEIFSIA